MELIEYKYYQDQINPPQMKTKEFLKTAWRKFIGSKVVGVFSAILSGLGGLFSYKPISQEKINEYRTEALKYRSFYIN